MKNAILVAKMFRRSSSITDYGSGQRQEQLDLEAVADDGETNKAWAQYTPCGQLTLTIDNQEAIGKVPEGDYLVYIVPCTEE